jgi:hypothetical protein
MIILIFLLAVEENFVRKTMATFNLIQMKRSATPGKVPTTQDLAFGELGINTSGNSFNC